MRNFLPYVRLISEGHSLCLGPPIYIHNLVKKIPNSPVEQVVGSDIYYTALHKKLSSSCAVSILVPRRDEYKIIKRSNGHVHGA